MNNPELKFVKWDGYDAYHVYMITHRYEDGETDDVLIGRVEKDSKWVVRGTRIVWSAYRRSVYIGSASTRKEAARMILDYDK